MSDQFFLELAKVLIWPVFASLFAFNFFRSEIKGLLNRIQSAKLPGGIEVLLPGKQKLPQKNTPNKIGGSVKNKKEEIKREISADNSQTQVNELLNQLATYQVALIFERGYQSIYGSQIKLLDILRLRGQEGLSYEDLAAFYQQTRLTWPTLNSYSLNSYLGYLLNIGLAEKIFTDSKTYIKITPMGIDFLEYIEQLNYLKEKAF